MEKFSKSDVIALLSLLSTAQGPGAEKPLAARQRDLLNSVRSYIGAHAWLWFSGEMRSGSEENERTSSLMYDGLAGKEPLQLLHKVGLPAARSLFACERGEHRNGDARPIISINEACQGSPSSPGVPTVKSSFTADHCSAVRRHSDATYVGIVFCRKSDCARFTPREAALVAVLFQSVEWLSSCRADLSSNSALSPLSPRERQVLMLLLSGKSSKEVANELELSTHTVADYLKQIYAKLKVSSRGELLALFIPGVS